MKTTTVLFLLTLFLSGSGCSKQKEVPIGVTFQTETIFREGGRGDNWCMTWAADNSQLTNMCDGNWLGLYYGEPLEFIGSGLYRNLKELGVDGSDSIVPEFHNRVYRVIGDHDDFVIEDIPNYPEFPSRVWSWFGYGIISVDGNIYSALSKTRRHHFSGPFRGIKLLKSSDDGKTWGPVNRDGVVLSMDPARARGKDREWDEVTPGEMFFFEEEGITREGIPAWPFSWIDFVQEGRDHSASKDNYVYIYSPEGAYAHKLLLARVLKEEIGNRNSWEYFVRYGKNNRPEWSKNLPERGYVHEFPETNEAGDYFGWYSWLPSVVYNEGLGLYIMVNGGTYGGRSGDFSAADSDYFNTWMHNQTGSLGFWYSENPYGPWYEFFYTEYWVADHSDELTYQPKLSPKWISDDGKEMVLVWSDAKRNVEGSSHRVNYTWNQMLITIETK
jgi:hypothetical protein